MRIRLAACLLIWPLLASADAPPVLASAELSGNRFELVFDQPMITWTTRSRGNGLVTTPEADCGWFWADDTTLVCETWYGQGTPLRKATPYRVDIGEGLWSQAGVAFAPTSVTLVSSPPALDASAGAWHAGRPTVYLRSSQPITTAAIHAVLDARFELEPIEYSLEPAPDDDYRDPEGVAYRWVPKAWPERPGRLRLSLCEGLRSPLGTARGEADEALLTADVNLPFRLTATSCVSQHARVVAGEKMTCRAGSDVLLLFSRSPSDAAIEQVGASLPPGLALAEDARDCSYHCFAHRNDNAAPAYAIRLSSTAAGQSLSFELPPGLDASDGSELIGRTRVNLDFASWPPGFRIQPEVRLALPGSESATAVEARNLAAPVLWREFSIGRRLRQSRATLDAPDRPEVFSETNAPEPAWGVLRRGGLSIGGVDAGDAARATALPAFELLVNRHGPDLLAWATEWADAAAIAGARIELIELSSRGRQKVLTTANTGPDGVARLSWDDLDDNSGALLMLRATQGHRITVLPLHGMTEMALHASAGKDTVEWRDSPRRVQTPRFGVTDRLLYRPGDTVHFRLWERERRLNRLHRPEPGTPLTLALGVPSEATVSVWEASTDAWGSVSGEAKLPTNLRDGQYCINEEDELAQSWQAMGACFEVRRFESQAMWARLSVPTAMQRPGDRVTLAAEAGYYSGGPAAGARLDIFGLLVPLDFTEAYPAYGRYRFVDAGVNGASEANPLASTEVPATVGARGRAEFTLVLPATLEHQDDDSDDITPLALAQIKLNASLRVGGEAGASSPTADLRIAAFDHYVGLRSEDDWQALDQTPVLEAVVVSHDGVALSGRPVEVRLETTEQEVPQVLGRCTLVSGTPSPCAVAATRPGRYVFVAESGEAAPTRLSRWFGRFITQDDEAETAELTLLQASDGESAARVRLRQPHERASALFVLEYDRVIRHWTQTVGPEADVDVPVTPALAPGATLRVMLRPVQATAEAGLASGTLDAAMRLDIPLAGEGGLEMAVADDTLAPGDQLRIRLHNASSQPRLVVVSVVDDAVHQQMAGLHERLDPGLPEFLGSLSAWAEGDWHGLEAWEWVPNFFRRQNRVLEEAAPVMFRAGSDTLDTIEVTGSRIKRVDVFSEMPAYEVLARMPSSAPGRDAPRVRRDFPDAAYWNPGVELAPGESHELSVTLPDNLTRWRVIAWSSDQAEGFDLAQATATTSLPVELRFGLPSRLFEGDRAQASVSARNATDTTQTLRLQTAVDGAGLARVDEATADVAPFAALSRDLPLQPTGADTIDLLARAASAAGKDAISSRVPVQSRWADVVLPQAGWLPSPVSLPLPALPEGAEAATLRVETSGGTDAWRAHWLGDLRDYPHRCWEQTLSRALGAALALQDAQDQAAWPEAQTVVDEALAAAPGFRDDEGHFHFFPPSEPWSPRGNLLLDGHTLRQFGWLRRLGQAVPEQLHADLRVNVVDQAQEAAGAESSRDLEALAVAVAALSEDGKAVPAPALQRLWRDWAQLSWHARSELVIALSAVPAFSGQASEGLARLYAAGEKRGLRRVISDPRPFGWAMGSDLRDQCAVTHALWLLDDDPDRLALRQSFLRGLQDLYAGGTASQDTQSTLYCLLALRAVDAARATDTLAATVQLSHGPASALMSLDEGRRQDSWQGEAQASTLELTPAGDAQGTLNYVAQLRYRQDQAQVEARGVGLALQRRYAVLRDGRWQPLANATARRGEWIRVTLQVQVPALRHFVAVTDSVPGGWVTRDVGLAGVGDAKVREVADEGSWWFDTRQTGATEVRLYAQSLPPGTHEVHYFAQAQHPGRYFAPPAVAELMYGRASRANTAGSWVDIEP